MKYKVTYLFLILTWIIYSCNNSSTEKTTSEQDISKPSHEELAEGFRLTENNCFSCHSPSASMQNRIAPPMEAIKKHYINSNISFETFSQELASFLNNPSKEKSKMPGAIERFNLMPKLNISNEQISKIATYIYYSELEKPDWFEKHYNEEKENYKSNSNNGLSPIEVGQNIAMKTKGVLGKNLLDAINSNGAANAVSFCSLKAIHLTDSVALSLNAKIKRVSDKNRNPQNRANKEELNYIENTKLAIAQGKQPKPKLTEFVDKHIGYYPILTNEMCLQCHGKLDTDISPNTFSKIKELYPNDLAIGYETNELRGIWVVEMDKK